MKWTKTHHVMVSLSVGIAAVIGLLVWLRPSHRIAPEWHLPSPSTLPPSAQQILHRRMVRHGEEMRAMVMGVVLLKFDEVKAASERIRADVDLARPLTGDATELNALLPSGFFTLQDELKMRTTRLAETAARGDGVAMAEAYGQLSQTCLSCHMLYTNVGVPR